MRRVHFLPAAEADLDDIYRWIAAHDERAAERIIHRLVDAVRRLGDYPESGRARPELKEGARSISVGQYVLLHRLEMDQVTIVRVVHGARDLGALLEGGEFSKLSP